MHGDFHDKMRHRERMEALRQYGWAGGFGGRGGPMLGSPFGGGRGRRRRGDVRLALLLGLEDEPRNGYQIMQLIEERSGGRWRPSPGSVYPALAQLEDQGFVRAIERDGQRLFELTDAGREHLREHPRREAPWEEDDDPAVEGVRTHIAQVAAAAMQVAQVADEQQLQRAGEVLTEARRALYRILAEDTED
jgi:DNA-binding PadR family transcriptional regulator